MLQLLYALPEVRIRGLLRFKLIPQRLKSFLRLPILAPACILSRFGFSLGQLELALHGLCLVEHVLLLVEELEDLLLAIDQQFLLLRQGIFDCLMLSLNVLSLLE